MARLQREIAGRSGFEPRPFCAFPFFWVGGILCLAAAIQGGFPLLCLERFAPGPALDLIEQERGTSVLGWPTLISAMRDHHSFSHRNLESVPALVSAPADVALVGSVIPGIPFHRGMSETMGQHEQVEERAIDPESGIEVDDMEEGELVIRGPGLMVGYYKKERQEVFDANGWFHTGDRVFMHDGRASFVGRYAEMIKSQGANVSPREVELALEEFPEVLHAFVVGLPHAERGEEVAAVLVATDGLEIDPAAIDRRARQVLSSYKVPTRIEVWSKDDVPWLPSSKPDKRAIRLALVER
jgi:acyl-CoA synthetase (AMP-forming)/AMP-acid ligase II